MVIIGIDPGFGRMGFGVIKKTGSAVSLETAGLIETDKTLPQHERLCHIYDSLSALIKKHEPDVLSIERLFFAGNQKTAIPVAESRGIALLTAGKAGLKVYEYTPPEIKRAFTGDGKADKKAMQKMVMLTIPTARSFTDDAIDAIALAIVAAYDRRTYLKNISKPRL